MGTDYIWSVVLAAPVEAVADFRLLATALGYQDMDGDTLSAPLSQSGGEPPTWRGSQFVARDDFVAMLQAGVVPPGVDLGVHAADVRAWAASLYGGSL